MRQIDIFAAEHFNGNINETLKYLLFSTSEDNMDKYVDELTRDECSYVYGLMREEAIRQYGSLENYRSEIKKQQILASIDMTEEEVRAATTNPFPKRCLRQGLSLLAIEAAFLLLYYFAPMIGMTESTVTIGLSIVTGIYALSIAKTIVSIFKFKKVKRQMDAECIGNAL